MSEKTKGYLLVAIQGALLVWLLFLPNTPNAWGEATTGLLFAGMLCLVAAVGLVSVGFIGLSSALTALPNPKPNSQLRTKGVYSIIRHPIYSGLMLVGIGLVLIDGIWVAGPPALLLFALLNYKARFEEQLLTRQYPEYENYMKRTGRFMPRIRKVG